MERWVGRVAMVTGASAGIGAAIAYQLQDAGVDVVALARRKEKIQDAIEKARRGAAIRGSELKSKSPTPGKLHCLKCDVRKEEDILTAFKWIRENTNGVDILVNNAGCGGDATLTETNTDDWKRILDINILGLSICTREAIQQMKSRGVDDGHIVHLGSIAGHIYPTRPQFSIYCASKNAVRVLTEGLRKELVAAKSRIRISEISPGLVKTDFIDNLNLDASEFWNRPHLYPEDIADSVLYVLSAPSHVQFSDSPLTVAMERWAGRVAVVTGASAGIGASIAAHLQDAGMNVVALARGVDEIPGALEAARQGAEERGRGVNCKAETPGQLHCRPCDVQKEEDIVDTFAWIKENLGGTDVLVNNAGLSGETRLLDTNTSDWKRVLDTNVLGLSICTREAVRQMREQGVEDGHVFHIGSVAGHIMPFLCEWSMYHASKHAVRVLTEGLRKELGAANSHIRVTEVSPGVVRTRFLRESNLINADDWYNSHPSLFSEDISDAVLYALGCPPHVQIHEIIVKPVGEDI